MPTINGKPASCSDCAFSIGVERSEPDMSKPPTFVSGTRRDRTTGADVPCEHECRACRTVIEQKCCADREPAEFPAARICSRYQAR